jgi:hypothetical protein
MMQGFAGCLVKRCSVLVVGLGLGVNDWLVVGLGLNDWIMF